MSGLLLLLLALAATLLPYLCFAFNAPLPAAITTSRSFSQQFALSTAVPPSAISPPHHNCLQGQRFHFASATRRPFILPALRSQAKFSAFSLYNDEEAEKKEEERQPSVAPPIASPPPPPPDPNTAPPSASASASAVVDVDAEPNDSDDDSDDDEENAGSWRPPPEHPGTKSFRHLLSSDSPATTFVRRLSAPLRKTMSSPLLSAPVSLLSYALTSPLLPPPVRIPLSLTVGATSFGLGRLVAKYDRLGARTAVINLLQQAYNVSHDNSSKDIAAANTATSSDSTPPSPFHPSSSPSQVVIAPSQVNELLISHGLSTKEERDVLKEEIFSNYALHAVRDKDVHPVKVAEDISSLARTLSLDSISVGECLYRVSLQVFADHGSKVQQVTSPTSAWALFNLCHVSRLVIRNALAEDPHKETALMYEHSRLAAALNMTVEMHQARAEWRALGLYELAMSEAMEEFYTFTDRLKAEETRDFLRREQALLNADANDVHQKNVLFFMQSAAFIFRCGTDGGRFVVANEGTKWEARTLHRWHYNKERYDVSLGKIVGPWKDGKEEVVVEEEEEEEVEEDDDDDYEDFATGADLRLKSPYSRVVSDVQAYEPDLSSSSSSSSFSDNDDSDEAFSSATTTKLSRLSSLPFCFEDPMIASHICDKKINNASLFFSAAQLGLPERLYDTDHVYYYKPSVRSNDRDFRTLSNDVPVEFLTGAERVKLPKNGKNILMNIAVALSINETDTAMLISELINPYMNQYAYNLARYYIPPKPHPRSHRPEDFYLYAPTPNITVSAVLSRVAELCADPLEFSRQLVTSIRNLTTSVISDIIDASRADENSLVLEHFGKIVNLTDAFRPLAHPTIQEIQALPSPEDRDAAGALASMIRPLLTDVLSLYPAALGGSGKPAAKLEKLPPLKYVVYSAYLKDALQPTPQNPTPAITPSITARLSKIATVAGVTPAEQNFHFRNTVRPIIRSRFDAVVPLSRSNPSAAASTADAVRSMATSSLFSEPGQISAAAEETYRKAVHAIFNAKSSEHPALAAPTPSECESLAVLSAALRLPQSVVYGIHAWTFGDSYRNAVREKFSLKSGRVDADDKSPPPHTTLTPEATEQLHELAELMNLSPGYASETITKVAVEVLEKLVEVATKKIEEKEKSRSGTPPLTSDELDVDVESNRPFLNACNNVITFLSSNSFHIPIHKETQFPKVTILQASASSPFFSSSSSSSSSSASSFSSNPQLTFLLRQYITTSVAMRGEERPAPKPDLASRKILARAIGIAETQEQKIADKVGADLYSRYVRTSVLPSGEVLSQDDMMVLLDCATRVGISENATKMIYAAAQKVVAEKILSDVVSNDEEHNNSTLASIRGARLKVASMDIGDIKERLGWSVQQVASLFTLELRELIEGEDYEREDVYAAIEDCKNFFNMTRDEAAEALEQLVVDRCSTLCEATVKCLGQKRRQEALNKLNLIVKYARLSSKETAFDLDADDKARSEMLRIYESAADGLTLADSEDHNINLELLKQALTPRPDVVKAKMERKEREQKKVAEKKDRKLRPWRYADSNGDDEKFDRSWVRKELEQILGKDFRERLQEETREEFIQTNDPERKKELKALYGIMEEYRQEARHGTFFSPLKQQTTPERETDEDLN